MFFFVLFCLFFCIFFFFNDTATTEIYTLSLHDALPISFITTNCHININQSQETLYCWLSLTKQLTHHNFGIILSPHVDRKSTRLNSSHANISYAVFCLKKKTNKVMNM